MEHTLEPRWYFSVLRRWLWLIVVCTLLGAAGAFLVASRMPSVYSASATLLVQQSPTASMSDYTAIRASELLASTYSQMLSGQPVMEAVVARLGLEETPDALAKRVKTELVPDTQLIRLSVRHSDPTRAALIANTIVEAFTAQIETLQEERYADFLTSMQIQMFELSALIKETEERIDALGTPGTAQEEAELARLETVLAGYRSSLVTVEQNYEQMRLTMVQATHNVIIAETAQVPNNPVRRSTRYTTLAAVVGTMLAVGVAFLLEYLDDTMKTPEDVSQTLGLDTIGAIGRLARWEEELVVATQPLSPVAEAFRVLYTNVRFSSVDRPLRTLLVTSSGPSEGKSITLANLAAAMAQEGLKVVAVDADLRRPRLHQLFGLDPRAGVTREKLWWGLTGSLLEGNTDGLLQPTRVEGLRVLSSGEVPPNSAGLLGSQRMRELLDELAQQADVVLIDSPPVLPVADAALLAQGVDGTLLVIDAGHTRRAAARHAVERLQQVRANLIGVVLNGVSSQGTYYSYQETYWNGNGGRKHRRRRRTAPPAAGRRLLGRRWKAD